MRLGRRSGAALLAAIATLAIVAVQRPPQCPAGQSCSDPSNVQLFTEALDSSAAGGQSTDFVQPVELQELSDPDTYEALAYRPLGHGPFPLLLYLHGAGEQGGSLRDILSEGATGTPPVALTQGKALRVLATRFVVVAPHTSHGWQPAQVSLFVDFLCSKKAHLSLDRSRLYVTGHSMGGYGALAAATTGRFAAAVPVACAGAPDPARLKGVPIWAFHGRNDVVVPSFYSEELISRLREMGVSEDNAKLTVYDEAPAPIGWPDYYGHASTIPAYATPELYDWLLLQRLASNKPV